MIGIGLRDDRQPEALGQALRTNAQIERPAALMQLERMQSLIVQHHQIGPVEQWAQLLEPLHDVEIGHDDDLAIMRLDKIAQFGKLQGAHFFLQGEMPEIKHDVIREHDAVNQPL